MVVVGSVRSASCEVRCGMSCQGSPHSDNAMDDYELDDDDYDDLDDYREHEDLPPAVTPDSDEDTEEASETDMGNREEPLEMKEQMYQDKLANLRMQLQQLRENSHPEYIRRLRRLEQQYNERKRLNLIQRDYLFECIEQDYILEKKAAAKEFEEKKIELKENLIADFEDKKKHIENEKHNMELNGDSMEVKPAMTRKLRRRPNEPAPVPDKRRKPLSTTLTYLLEEREIDSDLRQIARARPPTISQPRKHHGSPNSPLSQSMESSLCSNSENRAVSPTTEVRVEDGKLLYERRWFHRGQSIFVEGVDYSRFPAHISSIGTDSIWVKKAVVDGFKVKIYTAQLAKGQITIKRRAS